VTTTEKKFSVTTDGVVVVCGIGVLGKIVTDLNKKI
jgi:hypothetical protein